METDFIKKNISPTAFSILQLEKFEIPLFGWKKGANPVSNSRQNTRKKGVFDHPLPFCAIIQIKLIKSRQKGITQGWRKNLPDAAPVATILPPALL